MNHSVQKLISVALVAFSVSIARADEVITYNITDTVSHTLRSLGTHFVVGCTVLALAIVIAAVISRKK